MMYGGYDHSVDKKGRVSVPAKFRTDMGESFVICRDISGKRCICGYPMKKWEEFVEKLSALPISQSSDIRRYVFDGAFNVEIDSLGRILIPASLREFAGIESNAHIIGLNTNIEIWNSDLWESNKLENTPESIAVAMRNIGF